jgi:MFS transporter, DHA1 family, multidrug resistance protein
MFYLRKLQSAIKTPWQRTLYVMFLAQLLTAVGFSSIYPFFPLYVHKLGSSFGFNLDLLAGLVFSSQAFTMMIASPVWGALADRYGRKLMVERAMFGGSVILLLMGFVTSAEQLVVLRAIQGLVTGTVAAANALVASVTPREHAGYGMGLLQVGQGAGVALGPIIGGAVADRWGYAAAFYVTSAMLLLGGILVLVGVKEPFQRKAVVRGSGAAASEAEGDVKVSPRPGGTAVLGVRMIGRAWREIFTFAGVPVTFALQFISQMGGSLLTPILPLFIPTVIGPSQDLNTFTGLVVGANAGAATISSVFLGRLGDRTGHRVILITSMAIGGLLFIPEFWVRAGWQVLVLQAAVGIAAGGIVPSISALQARFTRPGLEGAVYGLDNSIGSGARALAPMIGSSIAVWMNLRAAFPITGGLMILGAVISALLLPKGKQRVSP